MNWADKAKEAADLADQAFKAGDLVTGIAAIKLAAECLQVARALEPIGNAAASARR